MQIASLIVEQKQFDETDLFNFLKSVTDNLNQSKPRTCKAITLRVTGGYGEDWAIIETKTKLIAWAGDSKKASAAYTRFIVLHASADRLAKEVLVAARNAEVDSQDTEVDSLFEQGDFGIEEVGTYDQIDLDCPGPCHKVTPSYDFFNEVVWFVCDHNNIKGKFTFKELLKPTVSIVSKELDRALSEITHSRIGPVKQQMDHLLFEQAALQQQLREQNDKLQAELQAEQPVNRRKRKKQKQSKSQAVQQASRPVKQTRHQIREINQELEKLRAKIEDLYKELENDPTVRTLQARLDQFEQMVEGPNFTSCSEYLVNRARMLAKAKQSQTAKSSLKS